MDDQFPNQGEASQVAIDYWQVLKNRYLLIFLTTVLVFLTAIVVTFLMEKKYESVAVVQVNPTEAKLDPIGTGQYTQATSRMMTRNFFATEFEVITTQKTLDRVITVLDLETRWELSRDLVLSKLKGLIEASDRRGTDLIEIRVRDSDRELARDIATEVAKAYRDRRSEDEENIAREALKALDRQLRQQSDFVEEKRRALDVIVTTKKIVYRGEGSLFGGALGADEDNVARAAGMDHFRLESDKSQLDSQIETLLRLEDEQMMEYAAGINLPENLAKRLYPEFLKTKRDFETSKASGLGPNHPVMKMQSQTIRELRSDLERAVVNVREDLRLQLEQINSRLAAMQNLRDEKKDLAIQKSQDSHDYVDAKKEFEMAQTLLQQMRIKHFGEKASLEIPKTPITIHEEPTVSHSAVSPKVGLNLALGGIVGLVFGIGIAFLLEYMDTTVKSIEDVERYLQVPVLAVIPKDVGVLHQENAASPDAEAYRILRTNIEFNRKNPEDNALTVVSGGAGEGKSTTLVNLAYICAQGGYTTLIIDADLRRPRLHTLFDINNSVGLTNYLTTDLLLEDVVLQTPVENLYFMPSGILPADAAGILNSRRMSELIQDVKQRFDLVFVDSPPILGVSDASVLSSEVDFTIIVIQHRKLPRNMLVRVKQAVENVGGNVIGVVLNNVDIRSDSQYQYYTSYYTYYSPNTELDAPAPSRKNRNSKASPIASKGSADDVDVSDDLY